MSEMKPVALKPCPHCGPRPVDPDVWNHTGTRWMVTCGGCGSSSGSCNTQEQAIAAWNNRPALTDEQVREIAAAVDAMFAAQGVYGFKAKIESAIKEALAMEAK